MSTRSCPDSSAGSGGLRGSDGRIEHEHRDAAPVGQRPRLLAILTGDVGPTHEVRAVLAHIGERECQAAPIWRSTPTEYSSVRGARVCGSSNRLVLGSTSEIGSV